jgi:hypothetical protein
MTSSRLAKSFAEKNLIVLMPEHLINKAFKAERV